MALFRDREEAGRRLAAELASHRPHGDLVVLGLPRGGVPVAAEIARELDAPLDVFVVRKIGSPYNPELAAGAVASGNVVLYNPDVLAGYGLAEADLADTLERERSELARRERVYRGGRPPLDLEGKTVILADDGIATGATMNVAVEAVRRLGPAAIVVAVPTAAADAVIRLRRTADDVVVLAVPDPYIAVGASYERFGQLGDEDVVALLGGRGSAEL